MASRPAWLKPVDSDDELVLYDALRCAGVTGTTRQHRLELPGGWAIHADIRPALRWAPDRIRAVHGGRVASVRDKQNDRQAGMIGWRVDRVTDEDITVRLDPTVAELLVIRARLTSSVSFDHRRGG
jgi:hypothetical protein